MSPSQELETERGGTTGRQLSDDLARRLDERLGEEQAIARLPTVAAGLVRDGELAWWGAGGDTGSAAAAAPTTGTQYRIGSISKTFAAVAVMRLRDEGALDLGDPVGAHLDELGGLPVTIAQLLSHTSGLRAETAGPWWERTPGVAFAELATTALRSVDLLARPGRRFHYSNVGYAVLGELVSRKRSAPFGAVLEDELWSSLGMRRTTLRPAPPHASGLAVHPHADLVLAEPEHDALAMAPAGQLWSTLDDLARWSHVLAGGRPDVLVAGSVSEMTEPIGLTDIPGEPWTAAYGLGLQLWNRGGQHRFGHSGSMPGFVSMLVVDDKSKDAVVALTNSTGGFRPALADDLLALVACADPLPPARFVPADDEQRDAIELTGTWYWGPREYTMRLGSEGRLELRGVANGRDGSFRPNGDGSYVGEWGYFAGERLDPRRRGDGSPAYLDIASFVFTRRPYDPSADIPGGLDERGWHGG